MKINLILQFLFNGLATGALYAIVALGFSLIYNTTKIFHIAHGALYTIAAYLLFSAFILLKLPLFLSILITLFGTALFGILIEIFVYRPFYKKNAPSVTSFISSLGLYIVLQNLIALIYGNQVQVLISEPEKTFQLGNIIISRIQLLEITTFLIISILFYLIISFTKFGKSLKALSDNSLLAEVIGIDIDSIRLKVFAIGSMLAAISAILSALDTGIEPTMGLPIVMIAIVSVIIGGSSVFEGALVGGILLGILQALSIFIFSARWQNTVVFIALIIFLLFKPEGILGVRKRLEEIKI